MKKTEYIQNIEAIFRIILGIFILLTCFDYKNSMASDRNYEEQEQNGSIKYENRYTNQEYLYSFEISDRLVCEGDPPPLPNHGCRINLSKTPESYIWVSGIYNSTDSISPIDELLRSLKQVIRNKVEITILERSIFNLGSLPGERLAINLRKDENESVVEPIVEDRVVAFRTIENYGEIIYTVGLVTTKSRYERDKIIFEQVLKYWKEENLTGDK